MEQRQFQIDEAAGALAPGDSLIWLAKRYRIVSIQKSTPPTVWVVGEHLQEARPGGRSG